MRAKQAGRFGIALCLAACCAASVLATPSKTGLQALTDAYPGIRYSESGAKDWRIWGRQFSSGSSARLSAERFITNHLGALFGVLPDDVVFAGKQDVMNGKFTAVYYRHYLDGVPADGRYVTFLALNEADFPLVLVSGTLEPIPWGPAFGPAITATAAAGFAAAHAGRPVEIEDVSPMVHTGGEAPILCYRVLLHDHSFDHAYRRAMFVDASTGRLVEDRDLVREADITGSVRGWATPDVLPDDPFFNPPTLQALPGCRVYVEDGASTFTLGDGSFLLPHSGITPVDVTATVAQSQWVNVSTAVGVEETRTVNVIPPGPANLILNPIRHPYYTAQVNALLNITRVHDFVKGLAPEYPGIDISLPVLVNADPPCRSPTYTGLGINFYLGGEGCANSAYSTFFYHEYGHFVIDSGHPDAAADYHEGIADVTSAFLLNDPRLFVDYYGPDTGEIRNLETTTEQYPCTGDPHDCGQVIGGAFWKAKMALAAELQDEYAALDVMRGLYINSVLLRPPAMSPMVVIDLMVLDDNDGQIANGAPHWQAIADGFSQHNLEPPSLPPVNFTVTEPPDFTKPDSPHSAWVTITPGIAEPDLDTVELHVSADGGPFQTVALGSVNPIEIPFDPQPCGAVVRWYLSVETLQGVDAHYPSPGALGPELVVYSNRTEHIFWDDCETDRGWTVQDFDITTGTWQRGKPLPTVWAPGEYAQPDRDSPDDGDQAFITFLPNASAGYSDVDGGPTVLTSPPFDLTGANALVSFYSWLFCDDNTDFLRLEVSGDGGATWHPVHTFATGDYFPLGPEAGRMWIRYEFVVGDYATPGPDTRVRFLIMDNPNDSVTEGGVDAVEVIRFSCAPGDIDFVGRVLPDGFQGDPALIGLEVELRDPVTGVPVYSASLNPDSGGLFTMRVAPGVYDVAVKADRWLREVLAGVSITNSDPLDIPLLTIGDVDGDNGIYLDDLNAILLALGSQTADTEDVNGNGAVDLADANAVLLNFGKSGPS